MTNVNFYLTVSQFKNRFLVRSSFDTSRAFDKTRDEKSCTLIRGPHAFREKTWAKVRKKREKESQKGSKEPIQTSQRTVEPGREERDAFWEERKGGGGGEQMGNTERRCLLKWKRRS